MDIVLQNVYVKSTKGI